LLDEFVTSAQSVGHSIDILDLYAEEFDPCHNMANVAVYEGRAKASPEVAAEQKRLMDADAMFFSGLVVVHASNSQGMGWPRVHKRF